MPSRPKGLKAKLWVRATLNVRLKCHWCPAVLPYDSLTVDHEPPLAEGGRPRQAVLACYECNQRRAKETNARVNAARKCGGKCHKRRKRRGKR